MSLERAAELVARAHDIAVLTGAGISVASGLTTFRGPGGMWEGRDPTELATPAAFARDPAVVWRFYASRVDALSDAKPNAAHRALVALGEVGRTRRAVTIATQNVDGLHQQAGSATVLELHGSLRRGRCTACGARTALTAAVASSPELPTCAACDGLLRPDVVWFGEPLPWQVFERAAEAFEACDLALVVGTSGTVMPAAGLVHVARARGTPVVCINPEGEAALEGTGEVVALPAEEALPRLVDALAAHA